jgi:hypothetical protein
MPDVTPYLSIPYPLPGDAVTDYPTTGRELAVLLESLLAPRWVYRNSSLTTAAQSFGASGALMPQDIVINADGKLTYLVRFVSPGWKNDQAGASLVLACSVDDVDAGNFAFHTDPGAGAYLACVGATILTPAAGAHRINARPYVGGGTMTLLGGPGGPGAQAPMLLTVEPLRPLGVLGVDLLPAEGVLPETEVELLPA